MTRAPVQWILTLVLLALALAACGSDGLPAGTASACATLGETNCATRKDCRADYCPHCDALAPVFTACVPAGAAAPNCPLPKCAATCAQLDDAASCNVRSQCHAVFRDPGTCDCAAPGCCMQFDHCADGPANCIGPLGCHQDPPQCGPAYSIAYTATCYEGCVLTTECL